MGVMPIPCPHFKITIVKRSQGQSAVAGAAYQSGERLFSEYDQRTKFYNKKKELVHAEIMLPSYAPPGYADRATLWNAVEAVENQWNSQLARRIVQAFPVEVPKEQYFSMIKEFCQEQFVSKGMIADFAIHDKGSRGEREDKSGPLIVEMLTAAGYQVEETMILPDEAKALKAQLIRLADGRQVNLILTTGGTGFAPRDITPEATYAVADRNAPGIAEAMRYHSLSITPRGMLSRAASVLRGKTLIVNLPGSPKAVKENLEYILPSLEHGVRIAAGLDGECARK